MVKKNRFLLQLLIGHKQINEPKLRGMFNDVDNRKLRNVIESLVQIYLLERPKEGNIVINPYLVTFIENILSKKTNG